MTAARALELVGVKREKAKRQIPEQWEHHGKMYPVLILLHIGFYIKDVIDNPDAYQFVKDLNQDVIEEIRQRRG